MEKESKYRRWIFWRNWIYCKYEYKFLNDFMGSTLNQKISFTPGLLLLNGDCCSATLKHRSNYKK